MCGTDGWEEIEEICKASGDKFKKFLDLPNGILSHDTFARVFSRINSDELQNCFCRWMQSVRESIIANVEDNGHEQISIDGKTLCGSFERSIAKAKSAIHIVSAWAN